MSEPSWSEFITAAQRIADAWRRALAERDTEITRLRGRLLEHACSCVGTEAAESGYGLEPERHEKLCGYRTAIADGPEGETDGED